MAKYTEPMHGNQGIIDKINVAGSIYEIHDAHISDVYTNLNDLDSRVTAADTKAANAASAASAADTKAGNAATAASNAQKTADQGVQDAAAAQATANTAKSTADANKGKLDRFLGSDYNSSTGSTLADVNKKVTDVEQKVSQVESNVGNLTADDIQTSKSGSVEDWLLDLEDAIDGLTSADSDTISKLNKIIKELENPSDSNGLANTILDWVVTAKSEGNDLADYVTKKINALKTTTDGLYATKTELNTAKTELGNDAQTKVNAAKATIDAYKVNGKAISTNPTLTGADVALTGYAKGTANTAVAATDTVNAAIAKLENQIDKAKTDVKTDIVGNATSDTAASKTIEGVIKYVDSKTGANAASTHNHDSVYSKLGHTHTITDGGWTIAATGGVLTFTKTSLTSGGPSK